MGHADWRDMSEYVVHLTDSTRVQEIFATGRVEAGMATGAVRNRAELGTSQRSVCLSEIPLGHLSRLADRHDEYGIGFTKTFVEGQGGRMVTYLRKGSPAAADFQTLVGRALRPPIDPADPLWKITQFYDNPGEYGDSRYEFDWEREWRVPGQLNFGAADVVFLVAPAHYAMWMRSTAWSQLSASSGQYTGLVLDPRWQIEQVQAAIIANGLA
jgi:hypothetical protein